MAKKRGAGEGEPHKRRRRATRRSCPNCRTRASSRACCARRWRPRPGRHRTPPPNGATTPHGSLRGAGPRSASAKRPATPLPSGRTAPTPTCCWPRTRRPARTPCRCTNRRWPPANGPWAATPSATTPAISGSSPRRARTCGRCWDWPTPCGRRVGARRPWSASRACSASTPTTTRAPAIRWPPGCSPSTAIATCVCCWASTTRNRRPGSIAGRCWPSARRAIRPRHANCSSRAASSTSTWPPTCWATSGCRRSRRPPFPPASRARPSSTPALFSPAGRRRKGRSPGCVRPDGPRKQRTEEPAPPSARCRWSRNGSSNCRSEPTSGRPAPPVARLGQVWRK